MTLYEFIKLTPDNWPHPDTCIAADYHDKDHELSWHFGEDKMISIMVAHSGNLTWGAMVDGVEISGKADKPKKIPKEIFAIFKELGYESD